MTLSINEQYGVVDAVTQFARLSAFDRVWTTYLESAEAPIAIDDVVSLERLTRTMSGLLERTPDLAGYLAIIVSSHRRELEEEYSRIIHSEELTEENRTHATAVVERHGGIIEAAQRSTSFLVEKSQREKEILEAKIATIRNGGFSPGDLTAQFLCNLGLGLICGGVFAPWPLNLVGVATGAAVVYGVEKSGEEC